MVRLSTGVKIENRLSASSECHFYFIYIHRARSSFAHSIAKDNDDDDGGGGTLDSMVRDVHALNQIKSQLFTYRSPSSI